MDVQSLICKGLYSLAIYFKNFWDSPEWLFMAKKKPYLSEIRLLKYCIRRLSKFFDSRFFTSKVAEVEDSCSSDFTFLIHLDFVDAW